MGRDKAWIDFEGRPLILRVVDALQPLCQELIIVTGNPPAFAFLPARVITDLIPGKGSLGGIYSGLSASARDFAVVVACDMPFLNAHLLDYMIGLAGSCDVVIPRAPGPRLPGRPDVIKSMASKVSGPTAKQSDLHPLHAVYSRRCIDPIRKKIEADDLRMISFHSEVQVRVLNDKEIERFDPAHLSLLNVNTPEDLRVAAEIATTLRENET